MASTRCWRPCRCPKACRWRRWPSAGRGPRTPRFSPHRFSRSPTRRSRTSSRPSRSSSSTRSSPQTRSCRRRARVDDLERAVASLERGGTIVYPTETVYGLGADATSENALQRLAALKERERGKPIAVLVSSREMLEQIVAAVPVAAARLIDEFWPGPLTLAFPAKGGVSAVLNRGSGTFPARDPSHPIRQPPVQRLRTAPPLAQRNTATPPH